MLHPSTHPPILPAKCLNAVLPPSPFLMCGCDVSPSALLFFFFFFPCFFVLCQDIFIVMQLHSGGELFDRIVGRPRFTEDEVIG